MILFLTKLANLLDKRGQFKMAREVDDLIEKLALSKQDMDLVRLIQGRLGVKIDGVWGPETNQMFLSYMKKFFPVMMKGDKFQGTLRDALELIKERQTPDTTLLPDLGPWASKNFNLGSSKVQLLLAKLDQRVRPGAAQDLINILDKTPEQTQQDFEKMLEEYATKY